MPELPYYLGCPIWSHKAWTGELFTPNAKPGDYLRQYAFAFNTVEGNTTFYALPKPETVLKWRADTPTEFRFCFKFPQTVSHHLRLQHAEKEVAAFLNLMAPLGERLGPFFLQLPASFGGSESAKLEAFLKILPKEFRYAVEVRHADFFNEGESESRLNELLQSMQMGRVIFDTQELHATKALPRDAVTREAQRKKPKAPARFLALSALPFIRFVGNPSLEKNAERLGAWAKQIAVWIAEGKRPYVFMHTPDDTEAPKLARYFHGLLRAHAPAMPELPPWPGAKAQTAAQGSLF